MAFTVDVHKPENLAVAYCTGLVRESEVHQAIAFSFASGEVPSDMDRVVDLEPTADLRELDADALHRIQSHVLTYGAGRGQPLAFRSVLIAPSPFHRPIAELYKAIWDCHQLNGVEFSVAVTVTEAATMLRLPLRSAMLIGRPLPRASRVSG